MDRVRACVEDWAFALFPLTPKLTSCINEYLAIGGTRGVYTNVQGGRGRAERASPAVLRCF